MKSQSQFCIKSVFSEFPNLAQSPSGPNKGLGPDRRAVERLKRFEELSIENMRRRVAQIETIIADFDRTASELEGWIQAEQNRTQIHDPAHFAYSTSARAMAQRRDKLKRSIGELKRQLADAEIVLE